MERSGRGFLALAVFAAIVAVLSLIGLMVGEYPVPPQEVLRCLVGAACGGAVAEVVRVRLARVLAALLVGASLSVSGAALQAVLGNPLASPFTLGVSQAAGFGAAAAIILLGAGYGPVASPVARVPYLVPAAAFLSSLAALAAVYLLASRRGMSPAAVVLAGVAVGFLFQALTMLVEYLAPNEVLVSAALFWMFGDTARATLREDLVIAAVVVPVYLLFTLWWMEYDALLLGDEVAASMGAEPRRTRAVTLVASALATAVSVAFVGVVGFVGLLGPHVARLVSGSGSSRVVIPLSGLTGAALLLAADTAGRTVMYPSTLPVGVTTALLGAPLLVALLAGTGRLGGGGDGGAAC